MGRILSSIILLTLLEGVIQAQSTGESGFTRYTRTEGLPNNYISGIVQDSLGYLWIGTSKGLSRFDGRFFTNYFRESPEMPLPASNIQLLKMQGTDVIGATTAGAFVYNIATRRYKNLTVPTDPTLSYWANNVYEASRDRHGNYILSTKTGLFVFDSAAAIIRRYDHHKTADVGVKELLYGGSLYETADGTILQENNRDFSGYDPVKNRIDTGWLSSHPALHKTVTDPQGQMRFCLAGKNGQLYIFNAEMNALQIFNFRNDSLQTLSLPFDGNSELDESASSLFFLSDTLLALTCKGSGFYIVQYHPLEHRLTLSGGKRFADLYCTAVLQDREGRLWVGTNEGLYKEDLENSVFEGFDLSAQDAELRRHYIRAIFPDHADLLVGLGGTGGVLVVNKYTKKLERRIHLGGSDSTCDNIRLLLPYDKDTIWVGTSGGIFWLERHNYTNGPVVLPPALSNIKHTEPIAWLEDHQHNIWMAFARMNLVVRYDRTARTFTEISAKTNPLLKITYCFSLVEDRKGNIWLAGDGLARWNPHVQRVDSLIAYLPGLPNLRNYTAILACDRDNNLWLYSLDNGIIQYDLTRNRLILRKREDEQTDSYLLASSSIIGDDLWLGDENGIQSFNIRNYTGKTFPYGGGLPKLAITSGNKGFCFDSADQVLYFGSKQHLIDFLPHQSERGSPAPPFFLETVSMAAGRTERADPDSISLSHDDNSVQLNFNTIDFNTPESDHFAFRVTPSNDSSWHLLNWQRSVDFNNLAPGKYHVLLKLYSATKRWPDQYKKVLITVLPPFWTRGWFIALEVLALSMLISLIYRNRLARMREKLNLDNQVAEFEMKALHAQMNPHFIFNALNGIRGMILQNDNRKASRYLGRFAQLIRLNLEHSRQTFISLRQNIEYLESYLEMEQLRFPDFSFRIEASLTLDQDEVRLVPMLIQPLVENAIWHGLMPKDSEKWVHIRFYAEQRKLICEIEDNGIGIRQSLENKAVSSDAHRSLGIDNIRQRIAIMNEKYRITCSLSIKDKTDVPGRNDTGTLITLIFPEHEEQPINTTI